MPGPLPVRTLYERAPVLSSTTVHIPVMPREVLEWLAPAPGNVLVDGTLGGGGHTRLLAEKLNGNGFVLGVDRDPAAIGAAETTLRGLPIKICHASYDELGEVFAEVDVHQVDGILLDLGLSSDQLADRSRGFSFESDGEFDLRFDPTSGAPAWKLLMRSSEKELADLIFEYGEERRSRGVARALKEALKLGELKTASAVAKIVRRAVGFSNDRIDSATRTFQALRIAVNDELGKLERFLKLAPNWIRPGGRLAIISFHSLEDRIVKNAFREDERWKVLTAKPLTALEDEVGNNPRSRSAKLRVAQRV
jgi:16S rRNA (cytosine1402-N4)-methyltransferase